jgi:multidrug resistance efflux pump
MESLPPIPTPPAERWREFRIQALPLLTFVVVLLAVVLLWRQYVLPTNMIGEVESIRANVISSADGTLRELKVKRFQRVAAGEEIAIVSTMDANTLEASFRAVETEMKVLRQRMELDIKRNQQSYELARLEYLKERVELNLERVVAFFKRKEADRQHNLWTNVPPLTSESAYELALAEASSTATNILEREIYLVEKEKTLAKIAPDHSASTDSAITDSIKAAEEVLRSEGQIVSIKSPIDGMVSAVWRHQGEKIVANANVPIVTISSLQPSRIIGYVRKPFSEMPKQGDIVNIRRQSFKREAAQGVVLEVSGQVEPISGTLVPAQPMQVGTAVLEMGLPFAVSIPSEMTLIPGEAVDLFFTKP